MSTMPELREFVVSQTVDTDAIHLRARMNTEFDARQTGKVDIEYARPGITIPIKIGYISLDVIDFTQARVQGFFDCLDGHSQELGQLALYFDSFGYLRPNNGCWNPADFQGERSLIYIPEFVVEEAWRGKGVGRAIFPKLFELPQLDGAGFIFAWPTVLGHLEPRVNGNYNQQAWEAKRDRIVEFFGKASISCENCLAGFRRLANSTFFCLAKDGGHTSHSILIDGEAPYQQLPPPITEEEFRRQSWAHI
ncbi:hypothetical protein FB45DRAFT_998104 [Roridomyces roridus]|uniref:Uncharacterized protein n=1 Tax=Roridomyces roridus TaxID=1738132 RepID=A0AAD7FYJ5_9AGAR|nr:hypothetical protein FB45DRAFT_998104 [Roridomyces roridus]